MVLEKGLNQMIYLNFGNILYLRRMKDE